MTKLIRITERDNVAVALHPVSKGETLQAGDVTVTAAEDIPQGHKIALEPIRKARQSSNTVIRSAIPRPRWIPARGCTPTT